MTQGAGEERGFGPGRLLPVLLPALLLLALCLAGLASCGGAAEPVRELRIGLLIPLTNTPERFIAHRAAERMVERVNAAGGLEVAGARVRVRLIIEDTGNQMERTMSAVNRLIQVERVAAILGPYYSREALPVGAVAEAAQVVMLSPTASNPEVTRGRSYVFRACLVDTDQAQAMASYAVKDLGLLRAAVLFDAGDTYSRGLAGYFRDFFSTLGGRVALFEGYPPGQADFKDFAARLRASGAQALYLPNFAKDLKVQLAQVRAAGFTGQLMGGDSWDGDRSLYTLPEAQGVVVTADFYPDGLSDKARADAENYAAVLGEPLDKKALLTLDALGLVLAAVKKAGSLEPPRIREGLVSLRNFEGLSGRVSFEPGGDTDRSVHILAVAQGRTELRKIVARGQQ